MLSGFDILIVDGYNIVHDWKDLKKISVKNLKQARDRLVRILTDFALSHDKKVIVVFDGKKVGHWVERIECSNVKVIFTLEGDSADMEIERIVYNSTSKERILVATSDRTEQLMVARMGGKFINAPKFRIFIEDSQEMLRQEIKRYAKISRPTIGDTTEL